MQTLNVRDQLAEHGIRLQRHGIGGHKSTCPRCSQTRKKKTDECLSVTVEADSAVWNCHHCAWAGAVYERDRDVIPQRQYRPPVKVHHTPSNRPATVDAWFLDKRHIPAAVLDRNGVGFEQAWMPGCESGETVGAITFPFRRNGEVANVKYRTGDKRFKQVKDAEKIYFGLDDLHTQTTAIICEGEIDKLSLEVAGFLNAVSVPDGAPKQAKDETPDPEDDVKFSYVWNCREAFDGIGKIIVATDGDGPGRALAEELARRYGKHRCWTVTWPNINDVACKDANDVLVQHGPEVLREVIENARPYPIKSLYDAETFETAAIRLFRGETAEAFSTGWPDLDKYFRVRPGELSVVTGFPNGGKSQFVDGLMVNLAERYGWRFALCSFENPQPQHIAKLAELRLDKPFWQGPRERMSEAEFRQASAWINKHFSFIAAEDDAPTIDWILETAKGAVMRYGIKGLLIDPYNEIEHKRTPGQTETEYVSEMLGKVKRFAQSHGVHVWFIAHPAKPQRKKDGTMPEPSLYDISGSANWLNKADIGVIVVRDYSGEEDHPPRYAAEVQVKKVRFKEIGRPGTVRFDFDRATGRYSAARRAS